MTGRTSAPAGWPGKPGIGLKLQQELGWLDDLRLVGYRGYGTPHSLHVRGRLIEAKGTAQPEDDGFWNRLKVALARMDSDEIPGASLVARFGGREYELFTDQEGYFQVNICTESPLSPGWHSVDVALCSSVKPDARTSTRAEILVPNPDCDFAVISDLDDTVIESSATNKLKQARLTLAKRATERTPLPGVATLYQCLSRGRAASKPNPIFYLSRSAWNLYDLFVEFMAHHDIPAGPMFLRDLALREKKSPSVGSEFHKLSIIRELLKQFPSTRFVLVGDTGQHDAEHYLQAAIEHPGRVRAVYLRRVDSESADDERCEQIAAYLRARGVAVCIASDTRALAEHMVAETLLGPDCLDAF